MLKTAAALLAAASLLVVGATTSLPTARAAASQPPKASAKKPKIGVTIPAADHGWTAGVGYWARRAMDLHPRSTGSTPRLRVRRSRSRTSRT